MILSSFCFCPPGTRIAAFIDVLAQASAFLYLVGDGEHFSGDLPLWKIWSMNELSGAFEVAYVIFGLFVAQLIITLYSGPGTILVKLGIVVAKVSRFYFGDKNYLGAGFSIKLFGL